MKLEKKDTGLNAQGSYVFGNHGNYHKMMSSTLEYAKVVRVGFKIQFTDG